MFWCLGCLTSAGVWSALAGGLIAHYCMYLSVDVVMASSLYVVPAAGLISFAVPVRNGIWVECGVHRSSVP